jgi:hypothetical protein
MYCVYYQAQLEKSQAFMVTATFKFFDGIAFDRAIEGSSTHFEFFVAPDKEHEFLRLMQIMQDKKLVLHVEKLPNRMACD